MLLFIDAPKLIAQYIANNKYTTLSMADWHNPAM
jgi:hypothetical protein